MTKHLTQDNLELFRRGKLSPRELLAADDHLTVCPECALLARGFAADPANVRSAIFGHQDEPHLTYQQLEACADDSLNPTERTEIEKHISTCDECNNEIQQFRSLTSVKNLVSASGSEARSGPFAMLAESLSARVVAFATLFLIFFAGIIWIAMRSSSPNDPSRDGHTTINNEPGNGSQVIDQDEKLSVADSHDESIAPSPVGQKPDLGLKVSLSDGGESFGIDESGKLVGLNSLTTEQRNMVKNALETGNFTIGQDAKDLRTSSPSLMGGSETEKTFRLKSPIGKVIMTDKPILSWDGLPNAKVYNVEVFNLKFQKVASSGPIKRTTWSPKLSRGQTYLWQVTAKSSEEEVKSPHRPQPDAKFKILPEPKYAEIIHLQRIRPTQHLALGLVYAKSGMLDEALGEFQLLSEQNPKSTLVRNLVSRIMRK